MCVEITALILKPHKDNHKKLTRFLNITNRINQLLYIWRGQ